jgi:hypothetical protein
LVQSSTAVNVSAAATVANVTADRACEHPKDLKCKKNATLVDVGKSVTLGTNTLGTNRR